MTREQALELLELEPDASTQEIRLAYKNTFNELQIRLTNAPTEQQKNLYGNRIKKIENAYQVLVGNIEDDFDVLPNISPVNSDTEESNKEEPNSYPMDIEQALAILGLDPSYSEEQLYKAYEIKQQAFEDAIQKAPIEKAKILLREGLEELDKAFELLLKKAIKKGLKKQEIPLETSPDIEEKLENTIPPEEKAVGIKPLGKKKSSIYTIGLLFVILLVLVTSKYGYDKYQQVKYEKQLMEMFAEAETLMNEGAYKAAYFKYLELELFCLTDCDSYSLLKEEAASMSMGMFEVIYTEAETLLEMNDFDGAREKFMEAAKWHLEDIELEQELEWIADAQKEYESLQEAERLRRQQQLLEEQAERERRERQLASANEMEASGDVYFRNAEYQKAYDFFQKSLDFYYSDRVWRKRNEAEKKLPINILLTFSQVDSRMSDYKDQDYEVKTENGIFKFFSFTEGYSYNRYFNITRLSEAKYVEINLDLRHISGSDNISFGLLFLGNGSNQSNRYGISSNGQVSIGTFESAWNTKWETTSQIKKGSNIWNSIKIIYQSGRISYFINGVQIKQETGKIFGNAVGIYQSGSIKEASYDNLSIKATF